MPPLLTETPHALKEFVGQEFAPSDWFAVTQEWIQQFAEEAVFEASIDVEGIKKPCCVAEWVVRFYPG